MAASSAEMARALMEQCERDLDAAIERLVSLRLDATEQHDSAGAGAVAHHNDVVVHLAAAAEEVEQRSAAHAPSDGGIDGDRAEWIDRLVEAMSSAGSWGDARARAARLLEGFDAASACRAAREVALRQNGLLKRAVLVQHRLCKAQEAANRELQRQLAACQDRVRTLETDNYALSVYLRNAQPRPQGGAVTGRFHPPEIF